VKLVHLVGFIKKKFVTTQYGHMNVKKKEAECVYCAVRTESL
jgi:hypothetical protein